MAATGSLLDTSSERDEQPGPEPEPLLWLRDSLHIDRFLLPRGQTRGSKHGASVSLLLTDSPYGSDKANVCVRFEVVCFLQGGVVGGAAAGWLWTAQGLYFARLTDETEDLMIEAADDYDAIQKLSASTKYSEDYNHHRQLGREPTKGEEANYDEYSSSSRNNNNNNNDDDDDDDEIRDQEHKKKYVLGGTANCVRAAAAPPAIPPKLSDFADQAAGAATAGAAAMTESTQAIAQSVEGTQTETSGTEGGGEGGCGRYSFVDGRLWNARRIEDISDRNIFCETRGT
eukprot:jgi/Bigna1/77680/fgenesh1_pg.49_\